MVKLRKLSLKDAEFISARWTGKNPLPGYSLPEGRREMEEVIRTWNQGVFQGERFDMLLIELDGLPAGLLSLYGHGADVSLGVCVHPDMQRKGAAAAAIALAKEYARGQGWRKITSECRTDNKASIALHKKCGLRETGRRINKKGNEVVCWELLL